MLCVARCVAAEKTVLVLTDSSSNINIETATSLHVPHSLPFDRLASGLQTLARTL